VSPLEGVYPYVMFGASGNFFGGAGGVFIVFIGVGDAIGRDRRVGSSASAASIPTLVSVTDASASARANGVANTFATFAFAFAFSSLPILVFRLSVGVSVDAFDVPEPNPPSSVVPAPFAVGVSNAVDVRACATPSHARLARAGSAASTSVVVDARGSGWPSSDANASARLAPGGGDANEATRA